jgi:hypothetical protein
MRELKNLKGEMSSRSELQFGAYAASALVKLSILVKISATPS